MRIISSPPPINKKNHFPPPRGGGEVILQNIHPCQTQISIREAFIMIVGKLTYINIWINLNRSHWNSTMFENHTKRGRHHSFPYTRDNPTRHQNVFHRCLNILKHRLVNFMYRFNEWKGDGFSDIVCVGEESSEPVQSTAPACCRR